jgi:lycopene cyclase domain-containing protein
MLPDKYTYLALMLGSLAYPLAQSFEHRVYMYRRFRNIWPALLITAAIFWVWDVYFTLENVWSFSAAHTLSPRWWGMPIEEWSFFLVVPYCCFFVYFVVQYFFPSDPWKNAGRALAWAFGLFLLLVGILCIDRIYTAVATLGSGVLLLYLGWQNVPYLGKFFLSYVFCLLPFLVVNGQLTAIPVVMYNNLENTGIRITLGTWAHIPIEDLAYNLLMLLMNVSIYEALERKRPSTPPLRNG